MYLTARQSYIDILTELVKEESPTLYLEDYLYYFNKAINEYMKKRYELFEMTQQLSDDLRFWKKKHEGSSLNIPIDSVGQSNGHKYRHLLSCSLKAKVNTFIIGCEQLPGREKEYKVTRLTSSVKAGILGNVFLEPAFYRPYFDIIDNTIEILIGDIPLEVEVSLVKIEYLKQPAYVDLTEGQVVADDDTSQVLEFTNDIGDEINKIAIMLILEREKNPRLNSNVEVNQSVIDAAVRGGGGGK